MGKKILGIDLGTTNSCCAVFQNERVETIENSEGMRTTPSIVSFTLDNEFIIGEPAKRQAITNSFNTISSVKSLMGRTGDEIDAKKGNNTKINLGNKEYRPEEISSFILEKIKNDAENYLGEEITDAVITVPAYFNDYQRQATKEAGKLAGLNVKRIINEPTAAALSYGIDLKYDQKIAVFDLGGGTFDITILELGSGLFEVLSTNGNTNLGGDNIDQLIMDFTLSEFKKKNNNINLENDSMALQRVIEAAEKAKIELSGKDKTEINLPFLTANASGPIHLEIEFKRNKLEEIIKNNGFIGKIEESCQQAIKDAKLKVEDIDEVILVGGSTRIPLIQETIKDIFGKFSPHKVNPDEVVALGAAIQGAILSGEVEDILLLDVTPLSLGIETLGGITTKLIERNTTIPTKANQVFSTAEDNQPTVEINVLQGEREFARDNKSLGRFILDQIPHAPRGVPQIDVGFDIDANGILNVSAKDKATEREQSITIVKDNYLSDREIEKRIQDAEDNAKNDDELKQIIEAKNGCETMCIETEKTISEYSDKLSKTYKKNLKSLINETRNKINNEEPSLDEINKVMNKFINELKHFWKIIYENNN